MSADPTPTAPDYTPASAMSLRDLRAEMLQRAAAAAAKARRARRRGQLREARMLEQRAEQLIEVARSVNVT